MYSVLLFRIVITSTFVLFPLFIFFSVMNIVKLYLVSSVITLQQIFYHSEPSNSWFLALDITDDGKSIVASYTNGAIQIINISSKVSYFI